MLRAVLHYNARGLTVRLRVLSTLFYKSFKFALVFSCIIFPSICIPLFSYFIFSFGIVNFHNHIQESIQFSITDEAVEVLRKDPTEPQYRTTYICKFIFLYFHPVVL